MAVYTSGCFMVSAHSCRFYSVLIKQQTVVLQCTNLAVLWDQTVKGTCWGARTLKTLSYTNVCKLS
jgi:hypothetical protein